MADRPDERRGAPAEGDRGVPGEGKGRRDEVGRSGIYPASGPAPSGDAPILTPGELVHHGGPEDKGAQQPPPGASEEGPPDS